MSVLRGAVERRSIVDDLARTSFSSSTIAWPSSIDAPRAGTLSAVFAAWRLLTDAVGTLPVDFLDSRGATRTPAEVPRWWNFGPNTQVPDQITYLVQVKLSLLIAGNAYIATPRGSDGEPTQLVPLDPSLVTPRRTPQGIGYEALGHTYTAADVLHIPGMVLPGDIVGMSPLCYARHAIESGLSAQDYGRNFFDNASVPPAVINVPPTAGTAPNQGKTDVERAREIAKAWHDTHGGSSNAGKIGVLIGGASLSTVAIPPEDAQWLESRQFGVQEIARFYGVPPHLLADSSNSTSWGSGLAEQNLAFGQFSLRPSISRIEAGHNRLTASIGRPWWRMKLNLDAVLRASLKDRYSAYQAGLSSGFLTVNEVRALEDLPPIDGGDTPNGGSSPQPEA